MASVSQKENTLADLGNSIEAKNAIENDAKKLGKKVAKLSKTAEDLYADRTISAEEKAQSLLRLHNAVLKLYSDASSEASKQQRRSEVTTRLAEDAREKVSVAEAARVRAENLSRVLNERSKRSDALRAEMEEKVEASNERHRQLVADFSGKIESVQKGIAAADKEREEERGRFQSLADAFDKKEKYHEAVLKKCEVEKQLLQAELEQQKGIAAKRDALIEAAMAEIKSEEAKRAGLERALIETKDRIGEYHSLFDRTSEAIKQYKEALEETRARLDEEVAARKAAARDHGSLIKKNAALQNLCRVLKDTNDKIKRDAAAAAAAAAQDAEEGGDSGLAEAERAVEDVNAEFEASRKEEDADIEAARGVRAAEREKAAAEEAEEQEKMQAELERLHTGVPDPSEVIAKVEAELGAKEGPGSGDGDGEAAADDADDNAAAAAAEGEE